MELSPRQKSAGS
jgi:hypothetical protein